MLVLGLDVLGNPYGLISGVGTGAKNFFYEPYQVCIFVFTLTNCFRFFCLLKITLCILHKTHLLITLA